MHPRLLSSVILIDPPIMPAFSTGGFGPHLLAQMSAFRHDRWRSRAEAAASFKKSKFYQSWDERVFDRWIEYGLRDLPTALYPDYQHPQDPKDKPVTLTTTKHQEVFSFVRPHPNFEGQSPGGNSTVNRQTHPDLQGASPFPFYRPESEIMFHNLAHIRPAVLFMFGGKSLLSNPEARDLKMKLTGTGAGGNGGAAQGRVQQVFFEHVGHLIPLEAVDECAQSAADFLALEVQRWQKEEAEFKKAWESRGKEERTTLTKEWEMHLGGDRKGKSTPKL